MSDLDLSRFEDMRDMTEIDLTGDEDLLVSEEQTIKIMETIAIASPGLNDLTIDVPCLSDGVAQAVAKFPRLTKVKINSWECDDFSGDVDMKQQLIEFMDHLLSKAPSLQNLTIYVSEAENSWCEDPDITWLQSKHTDFDIHWFHSDLFANKKDSTD